MQSIFTYAALLAGLVSASPMDPRADDTTCMEKGMKVTEWTVHDFDFHASYTFTNPAHQVSGGYVNFTLENPALDYRPVCSSSSSQLSDFYYGTMTYTCDTPVDGDEATYTFSRPSGELKINQTWSCADEKGYIKAQGGVTLDLDCDDSTWKNPEWKEGQLYSVRTINCTLVTLDVPVESMQAVL